MIPEYGASSVFDKKRQVLEDLIQPKGVQCHPKDQFFIENDIKPRWDHSDLRAILPHFTDEELQKVHEDHCITLSILAFIEWSFNEHVFRSEFFNKRFSRSDSQLPLDPDHHDLRFLGKPYARLFYEKQVLFKPCKIITEPGMRILEYASDRPWPFLEKHEVSDGYYSSISKVKIAPGCYSPSPNVSNDKPVILAYKRVRKEPDYRHELKNLEYLRDSTSKHEHICLHVAAITQGNQFYVFLEYTDLGDLEVLLKEGQELQGSTQQTKWVSRYAFEEQFGKPYLSQYIWQLKCVASALFYLHEKLELSHSDGSKEVFYCAHLDLKPHNILVYPVQNEEGSTGNVGKWVICDFGISALEPNTDEPLRLSTIGDIYNRIDNSRRTGRREGAHVAPELHEQSRLSSKLKKKCDIWSFGCISTEVFVFIIGSMRFSGAQELDSFRRNLSSSGYSDSFFVFKRPHEPTVKEDIEEYLNRQQNFFRNNGYLHNDWIDPFKKLVLKTLVIEPANRPKAEEIVHALLELHKKIPLQEQEQTKAVIGTEAPQAIDSSAKGKSRRVSGEANDFVVVDEKFPPNSPNHYNLPVSPKRAGDPNHFYSNSLDARNKTQKARMVDKLYPVSPGTFARQQQSSSSYEDSYLTSMSTDVTEPSSVYQELPKAQVRSPQPLNPQEGPSSSRTSDTDSSTYNRQSLGRETPSHALWYAQKSPSIPELQPIRLFGNGHKRLYALSAAGDTVAYLISGREDNTQPRLAVYDLASWDSTSMRLETVLSLDIERNVTRWDVRTTRIGISSNYASITALRSDGRRTGLLFKVSSREVVNDRAFLPSDLVDIIPSSNGIYAIICGRQSEIWLCSPHLSQRKSKVDGRKSHMNFLKCAFNPDSTKFFVWARSREGDRSSQSVLHALYVYDLSSFPDLPKPDYHKFEGIIDLNEHVWLVPFQTLPACIYSKNSDSTFLWVSEQQERGCKTCPIPNSFGLSSRTEIACSTDWFVSVRLSQFGAVSIHETVFQITRNGEFESVRDRKIGPLANSDVLVAASTNSDGQMIVVANPHGKIIKIKMPLG